MGEGKGEERFWELKRWGDWGFLVAMKSLLLITVLALGMGMAHGAEPIDFAHEVVPILRERCGECHAGEKRKGGLSMNTRALLLEGSENGEVVAPGDAEKSYLLEVILTDDKDTRMPPKGERLSAEEVATLKRWIEAGLPWEEGFAFAAPTWEPPLQPRRPELPPAVDGRENPVDRILDAYLAEKEIARPDPAEDAVFLRRLNLDVLGLLPSPEKLEAFTQDKKAGRRGRLISSVLAEDAAYAEHWLTFWNDLLRNDYAGTGFIDGGRKQITGWLYRALIGNKPFDEFTRELIAPTPDSEGFINGIQWRGNVNASQTRNIQFSQNISQVFLGINMKCASCHDSFIDDWKLEEAYNLGAIYATEPMELHRCDKPTGEMARAAWIFPELGDIDPEAAQPERLAQLAELMTHSENGRFTRTIVNRIWHRLMGRGIVHPVDAMHSEPWNEDLLDYLAVRFADDGYDLKKLIALIASSEAYQSQVAAVEGEPEPGEYVYRGPLAKRMTAEQFVDAVWQLTDAAPTRPVTQVLRMKLEPGAFEDVVIGGKWIWSNAKEKPVAGETIALRKVFELPRKASRADGVITADNEYTLFVNGKKIGSDPDWMTVETVALEDVLVPGKNVILISAKNGGDKPNAAAVFFEARLKIEDAKSETKEEIAIVTDESWEWTNRRLNPRGQFGNPPKEWLPVRERGGGWAKRVDDQIRAGIAQAGTARPPMVRASLVKSDLLMRSLGRPNREQVVTVRPEQLTTLQAIDLANGTILAKTLERGAGNIAANTSGSAEEWIDALYLRALSRAPTPDELAVMKEILGPKISQQGVEDVLWTVLMLPEFQLIR